MTTLSKDELRKIGVRARSATVKVMPRETSKASNLIRIMKGRPL
jgi:hypothetical protein